MSIKLTASCDSISCNAISELGEARGWVVFAKGATPVSLIGDGWQKIIDNPGELDSDEIVVLCKDCVSKIFGKTLKGS